MLSMNQQSEYAVSPDEVLRSALDIGEHLLRNGAEIHRVEDTISRICNAFGAKHVEVFSITSVIIVSMQTPDGSYCQQMRRVYKTTHNLFMVEELNRLSRELCDGTLPLSDLPAAIASVKNKRPYPEWIYYFGAMCATAGFSVFFGGTLWDALGAALVALPITFVDRCAPRFLNQMVLTALNSFCAGALALLLYRLGLGDNIDKIMIGTIMILIPGLALTNAVRDMMIGDILSGMLRLLQSVLLALMIAFGFAAAMFLIGGVL